MRRLLTPLVLVSPLILLLAIPAAVYGWASTQAASTAKSAVLAAVENRGELWLVDEAFLCADNLAAPEDLRFTSLNINEPEHRASLSTVGFDEAVIDLRGTVAESMEPGSEGGDGSVGSVGDRPTPTHVELHLQRQSDVWCLYDVDVIEPAS